MFIKTHDTTQTTQSGHCLDQANILTVLDHHTGDNGTRKFGKRAKWGAASLASGLCLGKYEVLAFYRLGVANAASRRREGRLRPPVVYNAGHQGKNYGHQWDYI